MHIKLRLISPLFAAVLLSGCIAQNETAVSDAPLADDVGNANASGDISADLSNDILIAPNAPMLTIAAAPGALQLSWVDRDNETASAVTEISLYEYHVSTQQEALVTSLDDVSQTSYVLPIKPHQLAWESTSYRVEICTATNCLSSERRSVSDLLINAVSGITAGDAQLSSSFGDDVAINDDGTIAVATSPLNASVLLFFNISGQWIQATTLTSQNFSNAGLSKLRVSISATGETLAVASVSERAAPSVVIFELLGENWVETATINAFNTNSATQSWDSSSLRVKLSNTGDRIVFGVQEANPSANTLNNYYNRLWVYERNQFNWNQNAQLSVPTQHVRLPSFSGSADLNQIFALSVLNGGLYLNEFNVLIGNWQLVSQQFLSAISPTADTSLMSSGSGTQIALAAWENQNDGRRAPVGWRLKKTADAWVSEDSVKLPPTSNQFAQLRIAADANLASVAIGWQASSDANLAFYLQQDAQWKHLFSVPSGLNLTRSIGLAQSVVISSDNSTTLIGTSNTGNGGVVTAFK